MTVRVRSFCNWCLLIHVELWYEVKGYYRYGCGSDNKAMIEHGFSVN